jgi:molybdopterin-containing oxidoreductase family membrane subunit
MTAGTRGGTTMASILVILGGLVQVFVIIVGGQAYPLVLFPGMEVTSSFADGAVAQYWPSWYEIGLGIGGAAFALLAVALAVRVLPFLPASLADSAVDPHHTKPEPKGAIPAGA